MKIFCKIGNETKTVEVSPNDSLYILLKKLGIKDKKAEFVYNDKTFNLAIILSFEEIGITSDANIIIKLHKEPYIEEQRLDFENWKNDICCYGEPKKGDCVWNIIMDGPKDSPYMGGKFKIKITFPDNYPLNPPTYEFLTDICHININGRHICLKSLNNPKASVVEILSQIFIMLNTPNETDAYSGKFKDLYINNYSEYLNLARQMTKQHAIL